MKTIRLSLFAILAFFCTTLISCNDDAGGDLDADVAGPDWDDLEDEDDDDAPLQFTKFMYKYDNKWATATIDTVNHQIIMPGVTNGLDITDVAYTLASSSIKISPEPSSRIGGWGPEEVFDIYRGAGIESYTAVLADWVTNDVDYIGFETFSYKVNDSLYHISADDLKFSEIDIANVISSTDITDVAYSLTPASATIYPLPESFNGNWSASTTFKISLLESSAESTINLVDYKYGALSDEGKVLQSAMLTLQSFMKDDGSVSAIDVNVASSVITTYGALMGEDQGLLELAFETIDLYETVYNGALFINSLTSAASSKMSRTASGMNIHFAQAALQQALIDDVYTSENLRKFYSVFAANKFNTSDYFPGAIDHPADSTQTYTRKIEANNRVSWGSPFTAESADAKRSTGCYAAPGSIVTVTVPESFVGVGATICVGSHTWDNASKPTMKRLDRITIEYPITSTETLVSNPLGGCIMIHVPYGCNCGIINIDIKNAHRHPYYSNKEGINDVDDWETERTHPGLWTFWETEGMLINMPTKWCSSFDGVEEVMADWQLSMDAINQFRGWDGDGHDSKDRDKTTLYLQCDLQMRGSAYYPGYPQTNDVYNPNTYETGDKDYYYLNGPEDAYSASFHELGHSVMITKFRGETEALVNFLYIVAMSQKFHWDLDKVYDLSFTYGNGINATLDGYATSWMVKDNFRNQGEMNYSNVPGDEMKYQHRGWGKYVEFANLFGWDKLGGIFELYEIDYSGPKNFFPANFNSDPVDNRILQFSLAAGVDCRPLIHFWGIMPENPETLENWIKDNGVSAKSDIIYDRLEYYKGIAPKDNAEFNTFQKQYCSGAKEDPGTATNGDGWYWIWKTQWAEEHYQQVVDYIQAIQDMYFPDGDPDSSTEWTNDGSSTSSRHESCGNYACTNASPWKRN